MWAPAICDYGSHSKWTPLSNYPAFSVQSSLLAELRAKNAFIQLDIEILTNENFDWLICIISSAFAECFCKAGTFNRPEQPSQWCFRGCEIVVQENHMVRLHSTVPSQEGYGIANDLFIGRTKLSAFKHYLILYISMLIQNLFYSPASVNNFINIIPHVNLWLLQ